jgi:hypothetical protein
MMDNHRARHHDEPILAVWRRSTTDSVCRLPRVGILNVTLSKEFLFWWTALALSIAVTLYKAAQRFPLQLD